jgi:hypothetical protein
MGGAAAQAASNTSKGSALPCVAPRGEAQCPEGLIRIGIFFDGTNNNMFRDWGATHERRMSGELTKPKNPKKKESDVNAPSNVAKLYELFKEEPPLQRKVYIIGIGGGDEESQAGDKGNLAAQGTGAGGRARIDQGIDELKTFVNTGNHQKALEKRVDVFGFSRGAAQARDFINKVNGSGIDNTKDWKGEYKTEYVPTPHGGAVPVRVKAYKRTDGILFEFMGIFDTVASFGVGAFSKWGNAAVGYNMNVPGRPADKKKTPDEVLAVKDVVEPKEQWVHRTFHAIAEDEYREMFPVDVMGLDPKTGEYLRLPRYLRERPYPGCHSDVGGGYRYTPFVPEGPPKFVPVGDFGGVVEVPGDPEIPEKHPQLCNIPLEDMHAEALLGHVPLNDLTAIPAPVREVPEELRKAYNKYLGERARIFRKHLGKLPWLSDYVNSMETDPVYLQAIPEKVFQAIQKERLVAPGYQKLATNYIHDSNTGALWGITGFLKRITNWTRTFKSQRGVNFRAPQNSYDPESKNVR